jgi:uncharacterized membrane protein
MDPVAMVLGVLRAIFGFILVTFIPGYALAWALYPDPDELPFMDRLSISFVLSIAAVILSVLFMDLVLGVDTTPLNIVIMLLVVTAFAALVWKLERVVPGLRISQRIFRPIQERTGRLARKVSGIQARLPLPRPDHVQEGEGSDGAKND